MYFRGDVPCGNLQGAMQSYVLTLTDISVTPHVTLPSSPPTPCSQLVGFNDKLIVADHQYEATIDAYGEPPCTLRAENGKDNQRTYTLEATPCLVPFGGLYSSGARAMALVLKEDPVLPGNPGDGTPNPAWRPLRQAESAWPVVRCEAETALLLASRRFTSCSPNLELLEGQSGIAISIDQIRGGLPCAPAKTTSVSRIKVEVVSVVGGSPSGPTNGAAGSSGASGAGGNGLRVSVLAGASG
ncbi:MAG: hypothetical protein MUF34_02405, partial [Polyangiaceae bacterium]|nr:hypothetical protein [Polyangiaceae bacterium]